MKDFILVTLPWVVVILFLAVLIIKRNISYWNVDKKRGIREKRLMNQKYKWFIL